jgi:hypothetical protein
MKSVVAKRMTLMLAAVVVGIFVFALWLHHLRENRGADRYKILEKLTRTPQGTLADFRQLAAWARFDYQEDRKGSRATTVLVDLNGEMTGYRMELCFFGDKMESAYTYRLDGTDRRCLLALDSGR